MPLLSDTMFDKQTLGLPNLKYSIYEGAFSTVLLSSAVSFIVPFAVYLGASALEVGFITAFPALLAAWAQLFSMWLLKKFKTKKWLIIGLVIIQASLFIPIALIPFIFQTNQVLWLILFYTLSLLIGALATPLWNSWMKEIIPSKIIGSYFGFRNSVVGGVSLIFFLIFGFSLKLFEIELAFIFLGIFLTASLSRFIAAIIFTKITEKKNNVFFEKEQNFLEFAKELKNSNFGTFVLYGSLMSFSIALTGPFVSYHLLNNIGLKNDYIMYTLIISSTLVATLISMPYWGKLIDRYGMIKVLKASSFLVALFPLLYILVRIPEGLIFVQFLDGLIFAGFNLALANFVYNVSTQEKIIKYVSYQSVFFGTGTFLGATISGIIQSTNINFWILTNAFFVMCLISFILRYTFYKTLINKVSEVKQVEKIASKKIVFSVITFTPVFEAINETFMPFENGLKKIELSFEERVKLFGKFIDSSAKKLNHGFAETYAEIKKGNKKEKMISGIKRKFKKKKI